MRYIFLCEPTWDFIGTMKVKRTPIAIYLPNRKLQDIISGDGRIIMTEVRGNISQNVLDRINSDPDVIECLELNQDDDNDESVATAQERRRAKRVAGRLGVPDDIINENTRRREIVRILRRRLVISQALMGSSIETARLEFRKMRSRLETAGIQASSIDNDDDDEEILRKLIIE